MPPKKASSAAWPPRRTPRSTARKSTQKASSANSPPPHAVSADDSPGTPTATATATSPLKPNLSFSSPKTITPSTSPKQNTTLESSLQNQTTTKASPKTNPNETTPEFSPNYDITPKSSSRTNVASAHPMAFPDVYAKRTDESINDGVSEVQAKTEVERAESVTVLPETKPRTDDRSMGELDIDETLAEKGLVIPENVVEIEVRSGQVTAQKSPKKVLKKTVRVVKKIVKKKVPKRVLKGQNALGNAEVEKLEGIDGGERPNSGGLGEVDARNSNADAVESFSVKVESSKANDSSCMEFEDSNAIAIVSVEAENFESKSCSFDLVKVEKHSFSVDTSIEVGNLKETKVCERNPDGLITENVCQAPVSDSVGDKIDAGAVEKTVSENEAQLEDQNVASVENQNNICTSENVNLDGLEDQNVASVENQNNKSTSENVNLDGGEGEEAVKEEVGNSQVEVGLGDGLLLSGEMEALERRRRRKTEIFVGGLDKDVKEEDIRKVFEEVGEVTEVSLVMNGKTGKNRGFAFVRFASFADARTALAKYSKVEICGKRCGALPVEGNDTIFLGNIDKKWKSEDVVTLLQEIGIEKIDEVTVKADPNNLEYNRGFAFLELETSKDAQIAYNKLQKKGAFGKHLRIKVEWAKPLIEPGEEEMRKLEKPAIWVKSVYAEYIPSTWDEEKYIPSTWDEEKVIDYFKKFGEIENVALAKDLHSSKRKDFAFVNYATREAALACIEAFNSEQLNDEGSKANMKVSLAKPISKGKQIKHVPNTSSKEISKENRNAAYPVTRLHEPKNKGKFTRNPYADVGVDKRSSTTAELVQLLREQASWSQTQPGSGIGSVELDSHYPSQGRKRPFSALGDDRIYSDPRRFPQARLESSYPLTSHSMLSQGVAVSSLPYHRQSGGYTSQSSSVVEDYANYIQTREQASFHGSSGLYRRCSVELDSHYPSQGRKRPFSALGDDRIYSDPRRFPQARLESSYPLTSHSMLSQGVAVSSLPYHRQSGGYTSQSSSVVEDYANYIQTREQASFHGSSGLYRRCK
ncbi:unnamed protein product [Ilex paraguariensis]|uniref:RRM domain-containing protein n=1 Tax=Ilex paraguariensis TaxID=185542 RepID=A0ABC8UJE4_9AQUA